jgi:hypothetical protein
LIADPWIALAAALAYSAVSLWVGDRFPFSRYSMYARLRGRTEGAVLVVRADGVEVAFDRVVAWRGIAPAAMDPHGVPCSLHWVVLEAQRWVGQHTVGEEEELPSVIEVGWRILSLEPGKLNERFEWRATGQGRLRP